MMIGVLVASVMASLSAYAEDFEVGDLKYTIKEGTNVAIAGPATDVTLTDELVIPETVEYESQTYNVVAVGYYAFGRCTDITSLIIPNSVTLIEGEAFEQCSGLQTVTLGNSVQTIEFYAFSGCTALTTITLPASVTEVDATAFKACTSLSEINVDPANTVYASKKGVLFNHDVTTMLLCPIGFKGDVMIPATVTSVERTAFFDSNSGCEGITAIYCYPTTPPSFAMSTLDTRQYNKIVLYVPQGSLDAYKAVDVWKKFKNIQEFDPSVTTGVESIEVGGVKAERARYDLSGVAVSKDYKGVVVIVYSDGSHAKTVNK